MPNNTLAQEVDGILKSALGHIRSGPKDEHERQTHLANLQAMQNRLEAEINERSTTYLDELDERQRNELNQKTGEMAENERFKRATIEQRAHQETFEHLRQINEGAFPRNISPVLYIIPLILVGVAEWYVNYSTFAATFVPVVAIAGTIIVGAIFAVASHLHGAYLKQLSEIMHPSVEYRNVIGRKIALTLATLFLFAAFGTIVSLRYIAIAEQLNMGGAGGGPFGGGNAAMVWSRLGPTIVINFLIWGLGTLYSWAMHERVPNLRETYRRLQHVNRRLDKIRRPFEAEQKRIKAKYDRERQSNNVAINGYRSALDQVKDAAARIGAPKLSSEAGVLRSVR